MDLTPHGAGPFARGDESIEYDQWSAEPMFVIVPAQAVVGRWLQKFKAFPTRQKPASFNLDEVMRMLLPTQSRDQNTAVPPTRTRRP